MRACQVAVLARAPVPGQAKTRLIPRLGDERAAALQAHLTARALQHACDAGGSVALWIAGPVDAGSAELARRHGAELLLQPDGDLGARMLAAARHAQKASMISIIIGTDCPTQGADDLMQARALLVDCDVVLQPALDGGYVLIGMNSPRAEMFSDIAWGTDTVLEVTRRRCTALGLRVAELAARPDLDRPEDLDRAIDAGVLERTLWS